jgi:streptothricin acetyltransferase
LSGEFQILRLNHNNKHLLSAIENDIVVDSHLTFQIIDNKIYYSILNVTPYIKKCEINEFAISDYIDSENKIIFFAIQNNECIGQIRIRKYWNNYAYIDDIVVDKNYRRKNIGTKLLDAAKEWARTNKLIGLTLETQNNNVDACLFYEKYGFVLRGIDYNLYKGFEKFKNEVALFWYFAF